MPPLSLNGVDQDFLKVLTSPLARTLLGYDENYISKSHKTASPARFQGDWIAYIARRAKLLVEADQQVTVPSDAENLYTIGNAALQAFLQSNVTGPPLSWVPARIIFPDWIIENDGSLANLHRQCISSLAVDGEAAYRLIPHVELFCLAECLLNEPLVVENDDHIRARLRVNFWHQRMLSENAAGLQRRIYSDLDHFEHKLSAQSSVWKAQFLVEGATIHIHHNFDAKARVDLLSAARETRFEFALTGRLGKRTKFQQKELSQLVVLAKSAEDGTRSLPGNGGLINGTTTTPPSALERVLKPHNLDLNDDTLLESISFSKNSLALLEYRDEESLPPSLASLDAASQPILQPLDSIILLALASSITNTSPQDGLTREETLPYATRVLAGGSANWQIYTQALLVRSRLEGHRSRTAERGVLQLQALVDQVVADTSPTEDFATAPTVVDTTATAPLNKFLPRPNLSESAPVSERLLYIHQLASPARWELEAELAGRWVALGGLRTALEIYERLEMWAEVALCWAANDREDKAREIVRGQLYAPLSPASITNSHDKTISANIQDLNTGDSNKERYPLPPDAPRLFCILGDIDKSSTSYERAWEISGRRYARAQRSLGRLYLARNDLPKANEAYVKSLRTNPQNHGTWFALGCVRLQMENWEGAVDAFGRAVKLEDQDAESWSNLAAALLRLPPDELHQSVTKGLDSTGVLDPLPIDSQKHAREAFVALKRAAVLKRESFRIWQNLLNVSLKISPPPYADIIIAQTRIIELRSSIEGENCIDIAVLEGLLAHMITSSPTHTIPSTSSPVEISTDQNAQTKPEPQPHRSGFEKMLTNLILQKIQPLITTSRRLWLLVAKLSLHLAHPHSALSAYEKAWRCTLNVPGWESGTKEAEPLWKEVVEATEELVDAYESLGERRREEGMGEGHTVEKGWRFKGRSAIRSVKGRAKGGWEGSDGWLGLEERLKQLDQG